MRDIPDRRRNAALSGTVRTRCHNTSTLIEAYAKAQGLWRHDGAEDALYSDLLELDMSTVEPSIAGPKRPQDRIALSAAGRNLRKAPRSGHRRSRRPAGARPRNIDGESVRIDDGAVLIAAITSCTNTSNPAVMIGAGLLARNARAKRV